MPYLVIIFLSVAIMVLGAQSPKPLGWVAILFAVLALVFDLVPHLAR
jgi:hypothetical protein